MEDFFIGLLISIFGIIIITIVIILMATKKKTVTTAPPTPVTPAKKTNFRSIFLKVVTTIVIIFIVVIVIMFFPSIFRGCKKETKTTINTNQKSSDIKQEDLRYNTITPCSPIFDYKFRFEKTGDPVWLKFPGIQEEIYWDGISDFKVPQRNTGAVTIKTAKKQGESLVKIYQVYN